MYPILLTNTKNKDFSFAKMRFLSGIFQTIVLFTKTFFSQLPLKKVTLLMYQSSHPNKK